MKILVDAMGGDYAPKSVVEGVVEAVREFNINIDLIGIKEDVDAELKNYTYPADKINVIHAPEVVTMKDPATTSIRKKKNSSITLGIKMLKDEYADAFISAGNTGAVVAASTIILGMLPGIERPAIGLVIPTLKNFALLIDVGANTEAKPKHLLQSAQMACVYARDVLKVNNPSVGLLNIGTEESKGSGIEKETYKIMEDSLAHFIGNVEANQVFSGGSDCIVCDGYVGNIVIKVSQGLMESAAALMRREISKSPVAVVGAGLMKSRLQHIKKLADYSEYGGAPLLGVNGLVMISHGRSSPKAIKNAIKATKHEIENNILSKLQKETAAIHA